MITEIAREALAVLAPVLLALWVCENWRGGIFPRKTDEK